MTNLIIFSSPDGTKIRSVVSQTGEKRIVLKDLCDVMGIGNSRDVFRRLADDEKGVDEIDTLGGKQKVQTVNEFGAYEAIITANSSQAKKMRRWLTHDVLPEIRQTGSYGVNSELEKRLEIAELKLNIFEEHCPAKFYDMDEVASLMHFYIKPPFGRNHLKRWLIERKILCTQAFKNDKPIQVYIDRGWFVAVIHEWFRKGKKYSENRYYMTPRGVMGIIDIAIREKLMTLPAPKQACLPGLYDEPLHPEVGGPITVEFNGRDHRIG